VSGNNDIDFLSEAARLSPSNNPLGPACTICGYRIHAIGDFCGCGGPSERFTLTLQQRMRYLDEEGQRLKVAAQRHFAGDRSPESQRELKAALRCWLDFMEDL
jgi:hypothetical protein